MEWKTSGNVQLMVMFLQNHLTNEAFNVAHMPELCWLHTISEKYVYKCKNIHLNRADRHRFQS